jgi:3-oxoacyl-[acyl-carrier protein] reductase
MTQNLKRALVTGGSGGIGSAICRQLAADGLHVWVHANRQPLAAQAVVAEILAAGGSAEACVFDVTDGPGTAQALAAMVEQGVIQVVVNNAGVHDDAIFPGMQAAQWHRVIDVCLNGFFNVTQPLMLPMIRTRWGRVINITSVAGIAGNRGQVNYAAAKGALHAATKALSLEVASRGITVNSVAPGIIETEMSQSTFDAAAISKLVPIKRPGRPDEVASMVAYLAGKQADYITGQIISINGGMI